MTSRMRFARVALSFAPMLALVAACGAASDASAPAAPAERQPVSTIVYEALDSAGDRLVFTNLDGSSTRGSGTSNFDVWVMSANGTNARPIASSALRESAPDWSPDGAYIVYVRSPALNVNEIVIARVSDGSIVRTIPQVQGGTVNNPRWGLLR